MSKLTFVWNGNREGNAVLTGLGAETTIAIGKDNRGSGEGFSPKESESDMVNPIGRG